MWDEVSLFFCSISKSNLLCIHRSQVSDSDPLGLLLTEHTERMSYKTLGEKANDLTQSYDKSPYTYRKFKNKLTTQKCQPSN